MSVCCRETLLDVPEWWEAILDVRQYSGGPPGCPGAHPGCLGVVGRPFRIFGSGRKALPDDQEWSVGPTRCLGVVRGPSRMSVSGREALPDVRE